MSTCARCGEELGRKRWWIDGKEYHEHCLRTAEYWEELDRLAEIAMQGLCSCPVPGRHNQPLIVADSAYNYAEAMLAERRRRRGD